MGTDQAARSIWVLIGFLAASTLVVGVVSRVVGPVSLEGWNAATDRPAWELPMSVRSTVWYLEVLLISAAAWLVWAYPQPRLRRRAAVLLAANVLLAGVVRPVLLSLVPEQGTPVLWLLFGAVTLLAAILTAAAVALGRTHRVSAMLVAPCILWTLYVAALYLARILIG